jgi:isoquinoline 1-oxidoreductase alpha subunit
MPTINVNGQDHEFNGSPDMPLLWFVRDVLGLTGTKFGCGMALCGACTVHVDGTAMRGCVTPVSVATSGAKVTTIEGLSTDGKHPVQLAWKELNVAQCGYCQAGQIMQAASMLKDKPAPTDADIDAAMVGNICRCGTYTRIRSAIHLAVVKAGGAA